MTHATLKTTDPLKIVDLFQQNFDAMQAAMERFSQLETLTNVIAAKAGEIEKTEDAQQHFKAGDIKHLADLMNHVCIDMNNWLDCLCEVTHNELWTTPYSDRSAR